MIKNHLTDDNTRTCPACGQRVPLNAEGKIVTHMRKVAAAFGRKSRLETCKGSGVLRHE